MICKDDSSLCEKCFIMKSFPGGDLSVVKVKERIELLIFEDSLSVRSP